MNLTPFDKPTSIDCGAFHMIVGAMPKVWNPDVQAKRLLEITDNDMIHRFLPEMYFKTKDEADEWLTKFVFSASAKRNLPVILRLNEPLATIGYMMCYSPLTFTEDEEDSYTGWAIEYFLDERLWGQGIMSAALQNILSHLQKLGVQTIRASWSYYILVDTQLRYRLRLPI